MQTASSRWHETSAGIYYTQDSLVAFYDDWDHWHNGFCRLLEITPQKAKQLIEQSVGRRGIYQTLPIEEKISRITAAVRQIFNPRDTTDLADFSGCGMSFDGSTADRVFANSISGNTSKLIVGNSKLQYAWQIDSTTKKVVKADSIKYDELYFQDPPEAHLGMRNYLSDQVWRLEKARRQLRIVLQNSQISEQCSEHETTKIALDIGSAAGYFRKALADLQFSHYGLEQSEDAIKICQEKFGYTTLGGEITDLGTIAPQLLGKVDLITLWDVIEHLDDGVSTLNILKQFLSERGVLVIRTPNLVSLEYELLGDYYYSFKLDHIKYYSPHSLDELARLCGLTRIYQETTSHLFKGLLGMQCMHQCMLESKGADIISIYKRSTPP